MERGSSWRLALLAAIGAAIICALALSACGGSSSSSSSSTTEEPASEETGGSGEEEEAVSSEEGQEESEESSSDEAPEGGMEIVKGAEGVGTGEKGILGTKLSELIQSTETVTPELNGNMVSIDVGDGKTVEIEKGKKLKIGFLINGGTTPFYAVALAYAEASAKKYGYELEEVDAAFDSNKQREQVESAIQSKKYDAWLFAPADGQSICELVTQKAPEAGILVVGYYNSICGNELKGGTEQWSPGTVAYVGGGTALDNYRNFMKKSFEEAGGGKILNINLEQGTCTCAVISKQASAEAAEEVGNVELEEREVAPTPGGGLGGTEQFLRDNPDTKAVVTISPDQGRGVVAALENAGLAGKVKVFVLAADETVTRQMEEGKVAGTSPYYQGGAAATGVQLLHEVVEGATVPRLILNDGVALPPFAEQKPPFFTWITPEIIKSGEYEPETTKNP